MALPNLNQLKIETQKIIVHLLVKESFYLLRKLEDEINAAPRLKTESPQIYQEYQKIIISLKWVAMGLLTREEILELIKNHLLESFEKEIDINDRMEIKFYASQPYLWQDFADRVILALKQNQQKLGPLKISEWLTEYDRAFGGEKHFDVQQVEFLIQNPQIKNLNEKEKNILKTILQFYDNLKPVPLRVIEEEFKKLNIPSTTLEFEKYLEKIDQEAKEIMEKIIQEESQKSQKQPSSQPLLSPSPPSSSPPPSSPPRPQPKIEGNIVNLKNHKT